MELEETKYARHDVHIYVLSVDSQERLSLKSRYLVNAFTMIMSVYALAYSCVCLDFRSSTRS